MAAQSIILTVARWMAYAITMAIPIILVRVFDQTLFGVYKQLFLISNTLIPVVILGLPASLFYFIPRDEGDGHRYVRQTVIALVVMGLVAWAGLVLARPAIERLFGASLGQYMWLLGLFVFLSVPAQLIQALPIIDKRPMIAAYVAIGLNMFRALLIIIAAVVTQSVFGVLWAAVLSVVSIIVCLAWYIRFRRWTAPGAVHWETFRRQLTYSLPFAGATLFGIGFSRFHEYYVAASVTAAEYAVYAIAVLQIPLLDQLTQSVVEVMIVRVASTFKSSELAETRRIWLLAVEQIAIIMIPAWAFLLLVAPDFIVFLFGPDYVAAIPIFRLFLTSILLLMIMDHGILRATDDTSFIVKANAVGSVVSIAVTVLLIRQIGIIGGVGGFLAGFLMIRAMGLARVAYRLELPMARVLPWRRLGRIGLAAGVATGAAAASVFFDHVFVRLVVAGVVFSVVYVVIAVRASIVSISQIQEALGPWLPVRLR